MVSGISKGILSVVSFAALSVAPVIAQTSCPGFKVYPKYESGGGSDPLKFSINIEEVDGACASLDEADKAGILGFNLRVVTNPTVVDSASVGFFAGVDPTGRSVTINQATDDYLAPIPGEYVVAFDSPTVTKENKIAELTLTGTGSWPSAIDFDILPIQDAVPPGEDSGRESITVLPSPVYPDGKVANPAINFQNAEVTYSIPSITGLNREGALDGGADVTVTITGTNFGDGNDPGGPDSTVYWNNTALTTTFVSETEITATIPTGLLSEGEYLLSVRNGDGHGDSDPADFYVVKNESVLVDAIWKPTGSNPTYDLRIVRVAGVPDARKLVLGLNAFSSIQSAVDGVDDGAQIDVAAGLYPESNGPNQGLRINKDVAVKGPNAGIEMKDSSDDRVDAAIIIPGVVLNDGSLASGNNALVYLSADGASIDGFTVNGVNSALSGTLDHAGITGIAAGTGIRSKGNDIAIDNNIVENLTYIGIWQSATSNAATEHFTNCSVQGNLVRHVHDIVDDPGIAYAIYIQGTQATVENNVISDVRKGIQIQPYNRLAVGTVSGNLISAWENGLYFNVNTASSWTLTGNQIFASVVPTGSSEKFPWFGIKVESMSPGFGGTFKGNSIDGSVAIDDDAAVHTGWGDFEGLAVAGIRYTRASGASSSDVFFDDNDIENVQIGFLHEANADIELTNNDFLNVTGEFIRMGQYHNYAGDVSPSGFGGQGNVLATADNTFNGVSPATATYADLFAIEDKISHKIDDAAVGLARVKTGELYVTANSGSIQRAIDAGNVSEIVNVKGGHTYEELVTVDKADVSLLGNVDGQAIVEAPSSASGAQVITVEAEDVTVDGFNVVVDNAHAIAGIYATGTGAGIANGVTITHNKVDSVLTNSTKTDGIVIAAGSVDGYTISNNVVGNVAAPFLGIAIDLPGQVEGGSITQNTMVGVHGDLRVRFVTAGTVLVDDNDFFGWGDDGGRSAQFEIGETFNGSSVLVTRNEFSPAADQVGRVHRRSLQLKGVYDPLANVVIGGENAADANTFNVTKTGLASTSSYNPHIVNNIFNALADNARLLEVNTKTYSSGDAHLPSNESNVDIRKNIFNGGAFEGVVGLEFRDHTQTNAGGTEISMDGIVLGGTGEENTFNGFTHASAQFIHLDESEGLTSAHPEYPAPHIKETTMAPFSFDIVANENNYQVGTDAAKLPSAMTAVEMVKLEGKVYHKYDNSVLGNVFLYGAEGRVKVYDVANNLKSTFDYIQPAINDAGTVDGDRIEVPAGLYAETNGAGKGLEITKSVTIEGPNKAKNGVDSTRDPEAIVVPGVLLNGGTVVWGSTPAVEIKSANVTLAGLKFSGDNPAIDGLDYAGMNIEAGIVIKSQVSGVELSNNIIGQATMMGYYSYGAYLGDYASPFFYDVKVTNNLIEDINDLTLVGYGYGLYLQGTQAEIVGNTINNTRSGLQLSPRRLTFDSSRQGLVQGNTMNVWRQGIYYNYLQVNATEWTFDTNTISAIGNPDTATTNKYVWDGIFINSAWATSNGGKFLGNIIDGTVAMADASHSGISDFRWSVTEPAVSGIRYHHGIRNVATSSNIEFNGNTVTGVQVGYMHETDANIVLQNNEITAAAGGDVIRTTLVDRSANPHSIPNLTANPAYVDATNGNTFNGHDPASGSISNATLFDIEDQITHRIDNPDLAFVRVKADVLHVTAESAAIAGAIQRAIDAGNVSEIVNVKGGHTYEELVTVNKADVSLLGNVDGQAIVEAPSSASGAQVITVEAEDVTVDGFNVVVDNAHAIAGIYATGTGAGIANGVTITHNKVDSVLTNSTKTDGIVIAAGSVDGYTISNNVVGNVAAPFLGIAIDLPGQVEGGSITQNTMVGVHGDLRVRFVTAGTVLVDDNDFFGWGDDGGRSAQFEIGETFNGSSVLVTRNEFSPAADQVGRVHRRSLQLKGVYDPLANVVIGGENAADANTFNVTKTGLASTSSYNPHIVNNIFNALADNARLLEVNTKTYSSGDAHLPSNESNVDIRKNIFNGGAFEGVVGLEFRDHTQTNAGGTEISMDGIVLGGTGEENTFNGFTHASAQFIHLDESEGLTSAHPEYPAPHIKETTMAPFSFDIVANENNYQVGTDAAKLPSAMTAVEMVKLEGKVYHKYDNSVLGNVFLYGAEGRVKVYDVANNLKSTFDYIQPAINDAGTVAGDRIVVEAGTYPETNDASEGLYVHKAVHLEGPNLGKAGVDPTRVAEAIIVPGVVLNSGGLADGWNSVVSIYADGATIDGFTVTGVNATLAGTLNHAGITGIAAGSGIYSEANNVGIDNNIVENLTYTGIWQGAWHNRTDDHFVGCSVSNNLVRAVNDLTNAPGIAYGVYVQGTQSDVVENTILNVRKGLQIQPYNRLAVGTVVDNTITAWERGLYYNYTEDGAPSWTISGTNITAVAAPVGSVKVPWEGIRVETQYPSANGGVITGSVVDGLAAMTDTSHVGWGAWGAEPAVWGIRYTRASGVSSDDVVFSNNEISNVQVGFLHEADADIIIDNNDFADISGDVFRMGHYHNYLGASNGNGGSGNIVAIDNNKLDGVAFEDMTVAEMFSLENQMKHHLDHSQWGLVRVQANALYLNQENETSQAHAVARAAAVDNAAGDAIHVNTGAYKVSNVELAQSERIIGQGADRSAVVFTPVNGVEVNPADNFKWITPLAQHESGFLITSSNVAIQNVTLQGLDATHRYATAIRRPIPMEVGGTQLSNLHVKWAGATAPSGGLHAAAVELFQKDNGISVTGNVVQGVLFEDSVFASLYLRGGVTQVYDNVFDGSSYIGLYVNNVSLNTGLTPATVDVKRNSFSDSNFGARVLDTDNTSVIGGSVADGNTLNIAFAADSAIGLSIEYGQAQVIGNTFNIDSDTHPNLALSVWGTDVGQEVAVTDNVFKRGVNLPAPSTMATNAVAIRVADKIGSIYYPLAAANIQGNSISAFGTGILLQSEAQAGMDVQANIENNTINTTDKGIIVTETAVASVDNNIFTGGTANNVDLQINGGALVSAITDNQFGAASKYIVNNSATDFNLSTSANRYETVDATVLDVDNASDRATLWNIENKLEHKIDNASYGFLRVKTGHTFATIAKGSGTISRAVTAAATDDRVNVQAGDFNEAVMVDKFVHLLSADGTDEAKVDSIRVNMPAGTSTLRTVYVDGFEVQGVAAEGAAQAGIIVKGPTGGHETSRFEIVDCGFYSASAPAASYAIGVTNVQHGSVRSEIDLNRVIGYSGHGIAAINSRNIDIKGNKILAPYGTGISVARSAAGFGTARPAESIKVDDNRVIGAGTDRAELAAAILAAGGDFEFSREKLAPLAKTNQEAYGVYFGGDSSNLPSEPNGISNSVTNSEIALNAATGIGMWGQNTAMSLDGDSHSTLIEGNKIEENGFHVVTNPSNLNNDGIKINSSRKVNVRYNYIRDNKRNGVLVRSLAGQTFAGEQIVLANNHIYGNEKIDSAGQTGQSGSTIGAGLMTQLYGEPGLDIAAANNWWGHVYGPKHATLNSTGRGDSIDPQAGDIMFSPWYGQRSPANIWYALNDRDGDGIFDADEDWDLEGDQDVIETARNMRDTDMDGYEDLVELLAGTDPLDAGSNPGLVDNSNDIAVYRRYKTGNSDGTFNLAAEGRKDSDGDGYRDFYEFIKGTNPNDPLDFPQRALGDVNKSGDGPNSPDLQFARQLLVGSTAFTATFVHQDNLDLNRDGVISNADVIALSRWLSTSTVAEVDALPFR